MTGVSNEVRVFVSSTFRDFAVERQLLHDRVTPAMEAVCRHYGLRFALSDLRYGVTERDGIAHRTGELCLVEVENCIRLSPELNFLCMLGHRYGSHLLPRKLDRHGFLQLIATLRSRGAAASASADLLLRIYDPNEFAGSVYRRSSEDSAAAARVFATDDAMFDLMYRLRDADPAADEVRQTLALSITHLEARQANALSGQQGAVTILRTMTAKAADRPEWSDDAGPKQAAQEDLRRAMAIALGDRAGNIDTQWNQNGPPPEYGEHLSRK